MKKINENENKNQSKNFNDKIAMFNSNSTKTQNNQNNQLSSKQNSKPNKNKIEEIKEKCNIINKDKEISKKEEIKIETKNARNIINEINNNNKNLYTNKKLDNEIKKPIENNNFQASLNVFKNIKEENRENKVNKNNINKNKIKYNEEKKNNELKEVNKEDKNKIVDKKIETKIENKNKITNKKNDLDKNEEKTDFKNKINIFNQNKDNENDKIKENNEKVENKEEINKRLRSTTIQERLKMMNIDQKEIKEIKEKEKLNTKLKLEENQKRINKHRETFCQKSSNITAEKIKNISSQSSQDKVNIGESIQKKIQNLENQKSNNLNIPKDTSIKICKTNKNSFEPSIIDKLKLIYQPKSKDTQINTSLNTNIKLNNENKESINIINKPVEKENEKEKINKESSILNKIDIYTGNNKPISNEIKNNENNIPKKLDFGKIFGSNLEKFSSKVKDSKREEIIKFAESQKIERQRIKTEIKKEIESDDSDDDKEKEEEIEKNQDEEEDEPYQLERISNLDDNKYEKGRESVEINEIKIKKLSEQFMKKFSDNNITIKNPNQIDKFNEKEKIEKRNTFSSSDLDINFDENIEEITKKMRKTLPLFNTSQSSSSIGDDDIFLPNKIVPQNEKKMDTFCECFFLASISKESPKIMENSYDNNADCNHPKCKILPAMQPEIIYKYPKEDIKGLEINNLAASICFPNGIKLCYEEKEENVKTVKNYRSSLTNQVGERFFAVTYHFFLRKKNYEFESEYDMSPIKSEIIKYQDEMRKIINDELDEDIFIKLNIIGEFNKRDYVNIPYCLCLISKYPYIEQMEICLESILLSIKDEKLNIDELNKYISYIVSSIPTPPNHCRILFPLRYHYKLVEIQSPYFRDINQFGDNPLTILDHIDIKNILLLFKLLVFEQKLLIVGKDNDLISQIILNFVTLLYPFEWVHTYIPIMSEKMLKFLQAFLPFFNGMNITLLQKAKPILAQASKGVFIFNIDDNTFDINSNYKRKSKKTNAISYINRNIPKFPKYLENLITKELKRLKIKSKDCKMIEKERLDINLCLKNLFMQIFTEILYDYKKYSYIIDDYPVFNSFLLIKDKEKKGSDFYKEFTSTQLFQMFIQNSLFPNDDKKPYFEERLSDFEEVKKAGANTEYNLEKLFKKYKDEYYKYFEVNKKYVIKPFFLKEFNDIEEKNISQNKKTKLSEVVKLLSKLYDKPLFVNDHGGVLFENQRLIKRNFELNNKNDPQENKIFYITNQNEKKENKDKDNKKSGCKLPKMKSIKMGIISEEEDNKKNIIKISQTLTFKEYELSEDEIDEIKDNIREIMTRVYRSDVSKIEEDKKMIIDSLKTQFGRDYFTKILNNGYKQDFLVKNLVNESYYFFFDVIFNTLLDLLKLEENDENINCAVKLIKSSQYIGTIKNKKEFLVSHNSLNILSDELYNNLDHYSLFEKIRFWELWIVDDLTKNELEIIQLINEESINFQSEEYKSFINHIYSIIDKLTSIMMKMKITNDLIITNINDLCQEYISDENKIKEIKEELIGQLQLYKVYSAK